MARAISLVRREVFAGAKDQMTALARDLADLCHQIDLRRIAFDRTLHAAIALAHLALAVAFTMAVGDVIGPLAGAGICLSAAAVALLLMVRAAEVPAPRARRAPASESAPSEEATGFATSGALTLAVARREVSGLLAMMSHELRTPLNAILGNADAIRHEILGPVGAPRYRESAIDILEGGQNLLRASEDMLTLTGTVAAAAFAPHAPFDLEDAIRDVLRKAEHEAAARKIALSWQPAMDRAVLSEASALHHAIARIVDGALAYADNGAGIHVELTPYGNKVEMMVTLTFGDAEAGARSAGSLDCGADRGPAALQIAVARTLVMLLGTHLHTAYGIDGRWRAILELPAVPAP